MHYFKSPEGQGKLPFNLQKDEEDIDGIHQINDPTIINTVRGQVSNSFIPGIVLLSWKTLRRLNGDDHLRNTFDDTAGTIGYRSHPSVAEHGRQAWCDVFLDVELEKRKQLQTSLIKPTYILEKLTSRNTFRL